MGGEPRHCVLRLLVVLRLILFRVRHVFCDEGRVCRVSDDTALFDTVSSALGESALGSSILSHLSYESQTMFISCAFFIYLELASKFCNHCTCVLHKDSVTVYEVSAV